MERQTKGVSRLDNLVDMRGVHKSFGGVVALRGVDFSVGKNEVVGLIGDNGAGKSTLIKILSGVQPHDRGEVYIKGRKIKPRECSVRRAHALGIETVYQEKALGAKQALWRNIFVGREPANRFGVILQRKAYAETNQLMKDFLGFRGGGVSPDSNVQTLSGGERQGVAIGRAMHFEADLVILDEPTNALSVKEIGKVLDFIRAIRQRGKSCVYISHTISNIYPVSDRFVVLDRGRMVAEYNQDEISEDELTERLVHHASQNE